MNECYDRSVVLGNNADGPVEQIVVDVAQEPLDDLEVAVVRRQVVVVLLRDFPQLRQVVPGAVREVVVLRVVAHVDVQEVPPPVVAVGLHARHEFVVLGNEVGGGGVRSDRHQSGSDEVEQCPGSPEEEDQQVGGDDEVDVEHFLAGGSELLHDEGTHRVDEVDEQVVGVLVPLVLVGLPGLPEQGHVGVHVLLPHEVVVLGVVASEGERRRKSGGDVAEHGHDLVDGDVLVAAEVDEVVDAAVEGVVEGAAEEVGREQPDVDVLVLDGEGSTLAQ